MRRAAISINRKEWAERVKPHIASELEVDRVEGVARGSENVRTERSLLLCRSFISIFLLLIVISRVDLDTVLNLSRRTDLLLFTLVLLLVFVDRFLMAYKWNLLTEVRGIRVSVWESFKIYLISNLFGVFLPTSIGGEIYRIYYTSKREGQTEKIAASVLLERFVGMVANATFAFFGLILLVRAYPEPFFGGSAPLIIFGLLVLSLLGFWLSVQEISVTRSEHLLSRWRTRWFIKKLLDCQRAYVAYRQHKGTLVAFFFLSVIEQSFFPIANYFGSRAISLDIELIYFIGIIPICVFLMRLPISINAIGVQEGLYIFFFSRLGLSVSEAFSLALLVRLAHWLIMLLGGILYLSEKAITKRPRV